MTSVFSPIPEILEDVRDGRFVVLVDAEDRENEGDLVLAAQHAAPERINQMTRLAGGYLCLSLAGNDCNRLDLHPQVACNTSVRGTPLTVSIDGHPRHGVGTGISAQDRARTVQLAIDPTSRPDDFVRPGHINPLRSRDGGVLVRTGQTEGSVDLARMAGLHPSALIIEIVREDGQMARRPDLERLCQRQGLKMCTIEQIIEHRLQQERFVRRLTPFEGTPLRTDLGEFTLFAFESLVDPFAHVALCVGGVGDLDDDGRIIQTDEPTLVRVQRRHLLGDIFGDLDSSPDGPTRESLRAAMRQVLDAGRGALVYIRPSGEGDTLHQRLTRVGPSFAEPTAVPIHLRELGIGSQILRDLGLSKLRLLSNHPKSLPGLEAYGLEVVEHVRLNLEGAASEQAVSPAP